MDTPINRGFRSDTMDSGFESPTHEEKMDTDTRNITQIIGPSNGFPPMANTGMNENQGLTISAGLGVRNEHGGLSYASAFGTTVNDSNGQVLTHAASAVLKESDNGHMIFNDDKKYKKPSDSKDPHMAKVEILVNPRKRDFNITVKCLNGKITTIENVNENTTVEDLMEKIYDMPDLGVQPGQQRLIFGGKQLEDGYTLGYYKIQANSQIILVLRLRGG